MGVYVGLIAFGAGCGLFKKPATPAEQARAALDTEGKKGAWIGHLDGTLLPVDGKAFAFSWAGGVGAKFIGLVDGQLCFSLQWDSQLINVTAEQFGEASLEEVRKNSFLFDARDALDYSAQAAWPTLPANHTQLVELVENRPYDLHRTRDDGTVATYHNLVTRIEVCGPAPNFGPATKFITLTVFGSDAKKSVPSLYIWQIDDSIDSSLVTGAVPATTSTSADSGTSDASDTSDDTSGSRAHGHSRKSRDKAANSQPATVFSGNLHDGLAASRQFSTFLKLAETAGLEELTSPDHFTIFAPTDAAFASVPEIDVNKLLAANTKEERRALREKLQMFVVRNTEPLDEIVTRGFTSNTHGTHILFKRTGKVITADGFAVTDAPIQADNGVIYALGPKP